MCCGDLSSIPLTLALVVSKEEDRCWFFCIGLFYLFSSCNLFLSYE
jgi:hypothetical protein